MVSPGIIAFLCRCSLHLSNPLALFYSRIFSSAFSTFRISHLHLNNNTMVLSTGSNGGRVRLFPSPSSRLSKRMLVGGSLLLMVLLYYVALPPPSRASNLDLDATDTPVGASTRVASSSSHGDSTKKGQPSNVSNEKDRPKGKGKGKGKGKESASTDNVDVVGELPFGEEDEDGMVKAMPWIGAEDDFQPENAEGEDDSNNCDTSGEEGDVDACPVANGKNADVVGGRNSATSSPSSKSADQDEEPEESESIQGQDDEQGNEKEDGVQQGVIERVQEAIADAEERVEKAAEELEEAIEELREEKSEDKDGKSTKRKMKRPAKEQVKGGEGEDMEDDEGVRREDRLGQAGPLETMDDEE